MTRRRKRERSQPDPAAAAAAASSQLLPSKRLRRPPPPPPARAADLSPAVSDPAPGPSLVVVTGLPADCTVLELKSRLEMYGAISRTRIDVDGRGFVAFRSDRSAEAAIAASLDPDYGLFIRSNKVLVVRAVDPPSTKAGSEISPLSKLVRAEVPLSRHGRSNKKINTSTTTESARSKSEMPYKGREIVAYDDLF